MTDANMIRKAYAGSPYAGFDGKKFVRCALVAVCLSAGLVAHATAGIVEERSWDAEPVVHAGFTDLGNYVLRLNAFTDPASLTNGIAILNALYDKGDIAKIGCTAMVTKNSRGEVIFGRNMDLEISQCPGYIIETTYGKYRTIGVSYGPGGVTYAARQTQADLLPTEKDGYSLSVSDCMNEKGLYIEVDMRSAYPELSNYGLHSKRGETTRSDGRPWSELRVCMVAITQLACQNCATVAEAVEYIRNSYDWYTTAGGPFDGWNFAYLMGDATGEYGLVEIARDQVHYIPRQYGHANFYLSPVLSALDTCGTGHGRLAKVGEVAFGLESLEQAMDAMKPIMWRNEVLWVGESHRVADGAHPNPSNQIVFEDDRGKPQLDWRSEHVELWPVLDDGRLVAFRSLYEAAVASTNYDPQIKRYFDEAIARGTLVVDDGVTRWFTVGEEKLTLAGLLAKGALYGTSDDPAERRRNLPYYTAIQRYYRNMNVAWCHNDRNFEAIKAVVYADIHIRRNGSGEVDSSALSKYDMLRKFYGMGGPRDEAPLRTAASVWTTSLNIGVNCAKKEMKIRFWENDGIVMTLRFEKDTGPAVNGVK